MATLAADKQRAFELGDIQEHPVVASDIIYEGAAVGESSGNARPLVAADPFLGFCVQNVDNSAGAAGDKRVMVKERGKVQLPISGLVAADIGVAVYASDDDTFTKTATANSLIGYVDRFVSAGVGVVAFDVQLVRAALQA